MNEIIKNLALRNNTGERINIEPMQKPSIISKWKEEKKKTIFSHEKDASIAKGRELQDPNEYMNV